MVTSNATPTGFAAAQLLAATTNLCLLVLLLLQVLLLAPWLCVVACLAWCPATAAGCLPWWTGCCQWGMRQQTGGGPQQPGLKSD
jgi:hypothetical protein